MLTITQIEELFYEATCLCLQIDHNAEASQSIVRRTWAEQGQPHWLISEDVVVFRITPTDDTYNRQREYFYYTKTVDTEETFTQSMTMTNVFSVMWSAYGPGSRTNSFSIFARIFDPAVRELLRKSGVYLVTDVAAPVRAPELFEGQWWERTDVTAKYNELVVIETPFTSIESARVTTINQKGEIQIVDIEP